MTVSSAVGLAVPSVYAQETHDWTLQAQGQDIGNLVAVLTLVVAAVAHARGSRAAGSVWLGSMLYVIYAFVIYALAVHFNRLFPVYVAVLGLSTYAVVRHAERLRASTPSHPPGRRTAAAVLIGTGGVFALLWLGEIGPALVAGSAPESLVEAGLVANPVHVLDLAIVLPGLVLTGVSLLRDGRDGRFLAGPWLVFSALMGTSIVAATVLMALDGAAGALAPMLCVSVVVLVNLYAALRHLRTPSTERHDRGVRRERGRWRRDVVGAGLTNAAATWPAAITRVRSLAADRARRAGR